MNLDWSYIAGIVAGFSGGFASAMIIYELIKELK